MRVACGTEMPEDILNEKMQRKVKFIKSYLNLDIVLNQLRILNVSFKKLDVFEVISTATITTSSILHTTWQRGHCTSGQVVGMV